jgi:hypothetical protein
VKVVGCTYRYATLYRGGAVRYAVDTESLFFLIKIYLQDVNTYTSVPDSIKLFLVNQFTCRPFAVRGVTVLPRQVMRGTAVKK